MKLIQSRGEVDSYEAKIHSHSTKNVLYRFDIRLKSASYTDDSPGLQGLRADAILILDHMLTHIHYVISKVGLNDVY